MPGAGDKLMNRTGMIAGDLMELTVQGRRHNLNKKAHRSLIKPVVSVRVEKKESKYNIIFKTDLILGCRNRNQGFNHYHPEFIT